MNSGDQNGPQSQIRPDQPAFNEVIDHDLHSAADQAKTDLDAVAERAKDDVKELGRDAREKVAEATETAKSFAAGQKDLAAAQIGGVAAAIGKVADELEGTDQQTVARYARQIASGLSSMGNTMESRDVDDLMGMAQDFGRKQPVAFLGAAALAGFVASRFALASTHRRDQKAASSASTYQSEGEGFATASSTKSAGGQ